MKTLSREEGKTKKNWFGDKETEMMSCTLDRLVLRQPKESGQII